MRVVPVVCAHSETASRQQVFSISERAVAREMAHRSWLPARERSVWRADGIAASLMQPPDHDRRSNDERIWYLFKGYFGHVFDPSL